MNLSDDDGDDDDDDDGDGEPVMKAAGRIGP